MIRKFIEKLSRGIIIKRKFKFRDHGFKIFVSPEFGGLKYWYKNLIHIDYELIHVANNMILPTDSVWDVGANLGLFSFASISIIKTDSKCIAIEADGQISQLLRKSVTLNHLKNLSVISCAISNKVGLTIFNIAERARATNYINEAFGTSQTGGIKEQIIVPTFTLDFLIDSLKTPDFIKIDVEGAENLVIAGAQIMISKIRPVFYVEISEANYDTIFTIFKQNDYLAFDGLSFNQIFKANDNTLFVPVEKIGFYNCLIIR